MAEPERNVNYEMNYRPAELTFALEYITAMFICLLSPQILQHVVTLNFVYTLYGHKTKLGDAFFYQQTSVAIIKLSTLIFCPTNQLDQGWGNTCELISYHRK